MPYPELSGRSVVVTGGASGIGATIVRAFHAEGARISFLDIDAASGQALAAELGAGARFFPCDLTDLAALESAIGSIGTEIGPIAVLVNNAAADQRHAFDDLTAEDFDWMMQVNLRHVIFAAKYVAPQMRTLGGGSIINLSSVAWMRGIADLQLYSAAKAAIIGFTNSLARQLGPDRIRVNAVAPGTVLTERQRKLWFSPDLMAEHLARQCIPDPIEPRDIAAAVLFLASDAARIVTKQCISVNAGSY